jgi:hypothetical protein
MEQTPHAFFSYVDMWAWTDTDRCYGIEWKGNLDVRHDELVRVELDGVAMVTPISTPLAQQVARLAVGDFAAATVVSRAVNARRAPRQLPRGRGGPVTLAQRPG